MKEYSEYVKLGLVGQSTVSGWRREGKHPAWVDLVRKQEREIERLKEENEALRKVLNLARF